jgi:centromeric protein E
MVFIRYDFPPVMHSKHNEVYRVQQSNQPICKESVSSDEHELSATPVRQETKIQHFLLPNADSDSNSSAYKENNAHTFFLLPSITPNKPVYGTVTRQHVLSTMRSYGSVIFAYGQTASGKTCTLSGSEEPGIIPRAMKDVSRFIESEEGKGEYLFQCGYLEIYNVTIFDLRALPNLGGGTQVMIQGIGTDKQPLREEVITSLKGVKDVLKRGEGHDRSEQEE